MDDTVNDGKRDFLKGAAVLGVASSMIAAAAAPRDALAQMLETGIREDSSLAKVRKDGVMRVGYSQTGPWFYKDAKSGELGGIYKDAVDRLAKEMEVKVEYKEVTFQNSTVGLRRNDYELYGSSLTYTLARALVVDYVGPLWAKGSLLMVHKDNAGRFKTLADFNDPKVTFSVVAGGSEEPRIPVLFPKAKLITTAGQVVLGAEPVRAKKADVWMSGDSDVLLFAKRNPTWAHVFDTDHPIDKRPNTWAVRYGDSEWKHFLDFFAVFLRVNGEMDRLFRRTAVLPLLPGHVDLEQHLLVGCSAGDLLGQWLGVHRLDQREAAGRDADFVALEVADQVPFGGRDRLQLGQGLLDPVLAEPVESGFERLPALVERASLGDGHDRDLGRVPAGAPDALPDLG